MFQILMEQQNIIEVIFYEHLDWQKK